MNASYQIAIWLFAALVAATPYDCPSPLTNTVILRSTVTLKNWGNTNIQAPSAIPFASGVAHSTASTTPTSLVASTSALSASESGLSPVTVTLLSTVSVLASSAASFLSTLETGNTAATTVTITLENTVPARSTILVTSAPAAWSTGITSAPLTISITNMYGKQLSVSFDSDAGSASPVGNPSATALPDNALTQYAFPTQWAGRIYVGPNLNPMGSKIEGSFTGPPDVDVSYVDGYSVPITCSSGGIPVSGCNVELFNQSGIPCPNQVEGPVCLNPAQQIAKGPAPPFFAACKGAAYTYPQDDTANVSNLNSTQISCCIGTLCKAPARQPKRQPVGIQPDRRRALLPFLPPHKRRLRHRHLPATIPYPRVA